MAVQTFGNITPVQAAFSAKTLLERALPMLILEQIGQMKPLPAHNTKTINFRRHMLGSNTGIGTMGQATIASAFALTEGTTPTELVTTMQNVTITLAQYGAVVGISDVVEDTHVDDVLAEYMGILGEHAGQVVELMRWEALRAGSAGNTILCQDGAGAAAATEALIKIPVTAAEIRGAVRSIRTANGQPITKVVKSSVNYGTEACEAAYVAVVHSDMEGTIRKQLGGNFTPIADYGSNASILKGEFGNFENVRFLSSSLVGKRPNGSLNGGATTSAAVAASPNLLSDSGVNVNLYDILVFAADSWAGVALKGEFAVSPSMIRATPCDSDPLGQRSKAGYKTMQACDILQAAHIKKIVTGAYKDALLTL